MTVVDHRTGSTPLGDLMRSWFDDGDGSVVYFLLDAANASVKIGRTCDLRSRLATLRTGSSTPLTLLGTFAGGARAEADMHATFAAIRTHGEWFEATDRLLATARALCGEGWRF